MTMKKLEREEQLAAEKTKVEIAAKDADHINAYVEMKRMGMNTEALQEKMSKNALKTAIPLASSEEFQRKLGHQKIRSKQSQHAIGLPAILVLSAILFLIAEHHFDFDIVEIINSHLFNR